MGLEETLKEVPEKLKRTLNHARRVYSPKRIIVPLFLASSLALLSCDSGTEPEYTPPERNNPTQPTQPTNHDPSFYFNNCDFSLDEHGFFSCEMIGSDPDGDTVNYRFQSAPSWLSISNNYVYGNAPEVIQDETFEFSVEIRDGKGGSNIGSETISVRNVSDTYVITQDTTNQVSSADSNSVNFSNPVEFQEGDQIVADTTGIFPEGTIRKVTDVSSDGKTVYTQQGNLGEAVGTGDLSYTHILTNPEVSSFTGLEGVAMMRDVGASTTSREFGIKIENLVLYDVDGNPATTYDQIIANGNIGVDFSFDMNIEIRERRLEDFEMKSNVQIDSDINIGSNAYGFAQTNNITIAEYSFSPIVAPIGPIPLVMIPKLSVGISIDPTQLNALSVNVNQTASLETLLEYYGNWNAEANFENSFTFSNPVFEGDWNLGVFAGPKMSLDLYGVAGPFIGVGGGLIFEGSPSEWALYAGLNAYAGVSIGLLNNNVSAYAKQVIRERWILASSEDTTTTPPPTDSTFTDPRDGQVYKLVQIGNQTWMAENLNYEHENSRFYNEDETMEEIYGRLYERTGALESCPPEWDIPTDNEWRTLFEFLGGKNVPGTGGKMKTTGTLEEGTGLWKYPNYGATNESGFTALPGGKSDVSQGERYFEDLDERAYFWVKTDEGAFAYALDYDTHMAGSYTFTGANYQDLPSFSVRCIKE